MIHATTRATALALGGLLFSGTAFAQAAPTPTASPATTQSATNTIQTSERCATSGSRVISGTYDPKTGALNTKTTLSACVIRNGDKFDGTDITIGTLLATAMGFTIDITSTVNTTIVRADGSTVSRACTSTKNGTYTSATQTFDGTTAKSNCSVAGKVLEHENVIEHLLRAATGDDEGGGENTNQRMMPPQADEDHIKHLSEPSDDDEHKPSTTTQPPSPTIQTPATTVSATNGKTLYASNNCGGCHGVVPASMNVLAGANNPAAIQSAITGNLGNMGKFSGLSSQDLADIAAYLATPTL